MKCPPECRCSREHVWVRRCVGSDVLVGITFHAQQSLRNIEFVDLPTAGGVFAQGNIFGTVESTKACVDLICPVSGEVMEINELVQEDPSLLNRDPYGQGWLLKLAMKDPAQLEKLLSSGDYEGFIAVKP